MTKLQRTVRISAACVAALALLSACSSGASPSSAPAPGASGTPNPNAIETNPAGDIPDTQAFVAYTPPDKTYTVQVPSGWARTGSGTAVTFTDKYNSIRVETIPRPSAPTVSSAQPAQCRRSSPAPRGTSRARCPPSRARQGRRS